MSSRALRKLQGQTHQELPTVKVPQSDSDNNDEDINCQKSKKSKAKTPLNPFELLEADDVDEEDEQNGAEIEKSNHIEEPSEPKVVTKKKKRKKKKKSKESDVKDTESFQDEDEIDASIREVNRILEQTGVSGGILDTAKSASGVTHSMRALLCVEHKNLNPDNEMKRIFGSRVVQTEASRRQRQRGRMKQKISWLTSPKDNWPPMGKIGLSMSLVENRGDCQVFTFEHNHSYQQTQFQFYDAVESLNPQNIANIIQLHPYHVDSVIQLSEVFRMGEDMQAAAELIERALFSCEMCFHPLFSLTTGSCRLEFKRSENRPFYLALFKHLAIVGQKGCNRTALEFCKLLLSLDPDDDPMCVLLMIDFYAIRAKEYSFLTRLCEEWEAHRNLSQLPNFAFSVALALYHMAIQTNQTDTTAADEKLQHALLMFPSVLHLLLDKCNVNPDPKVSSHTYFGPNSHYSQPDALKQLVALYVGRCNSCWKEPEVLLWLEHNVHTVIDLVDKGDPRVESFNEKRKSRYQGTPRNILRHILISEIQDAKVALPPDLANTAVLSYDPLPPLDSVSSYQRPERRRQFHDQGALSMFFRSLLPNFNPEEPAEEGAVGGGGEGANLRQGIGTLMDAMRDLLQNIRPVDPPVENRDGNEEEEEEMEEWD